MSQVSMNLRIDGSDDELVITIAADPKVIGLLAANATEIAAMIRSKAGAIIGGELIQSTVNTPLKREH